LFLSEEREEVGLEFGATAIQTARQRKGNISTGDDSRGSFKKKLRERYMNTPNNFFSR
jgi:hypothetical protein